MPPHVTDLLIDAAARAPDHGMVVPGGQDRSWPELIEAARCAAGGLAAAGVEPGSPVLLLVVDISDFFPVFWGCQWAGATPVPLAPPRDGSAGERERVLRVAARLGGPPIVVDRGVRVPGMKLLDAGDLVEASPMSDRRPPPQETAGLIQFSSGSTGHPRGVVLSHANLLANVDQMARAYPIDDRDVKLTWMPHWHDMGLIGCHLLPLRAAMREVRLSPVAVFKDPVGWLRAADAHGATLLTTTNAMLDRLVQRLERRRPRDLDLGSLRLIFNGAEPISPAVCRRFCQFTGLSEDVHFPLYGLAEASVGVVAAQRGGLTTREVEGREVVVIGAPLPKLQLRIVDDEDAPLPDGSAGHVQFRGPNAFQGYLGDPQATAEAHCGDWVRTGDLGILEGGLLTITGRHKDVICVEGRSLHAHDVEAAAEAVPGVRANGAVAIADTRGDVERLALLIQVAPDHATAPVLWAVRRAITAACGAEPSAVLPIPRIPRTTSGKKRRTLLAGDLAAGRLDDAVGDTLDLVREVWGAALGRPVEESQLDTAFTELGGGSIEAVDVLLRLEARLGVVPDHRLLLRGETVRAMAMLLERNPPRAAPLPRAYGQQPVAITGAACLLPGADSPAALARLVAEGRVAISPPPPGRWQDSGRSYAGGFLGDVLGFDAARFGIDDDEAAAMDPQQRLLLTVAAQALEGAALDTHQVGVWVGAGQQSNLPAVLDKLDQDLPPGTMAGNLLNMLAARVAHHMDLRGPALTVDTACSASLVAAHLASRAMASGECEAAVVAGVNLNLGADAHRLFELAGALSATGRCQPFTDQADGMVPGEGVVALVLEPLQAAKARGVSILGVMLGSAVNNDGASLGVMAPNPAGQEAVIRAALAAARVEASRVSFVEAHGTGTPIGDPVERSVLARCYPHGPRIGAIKGQLGHGLAAAGITGLLRALGEIEEGQLGAVSSFGFGGTNAHVLLEGGPAKLNEIDTVPPRGPRHELGAPDARGWLWRVQRDTAGGLQWTSCPRGPTPLVTGGTYLVTGGTGALGAVLARYLARHYGARLLLVGRREAGATQASLLREIEALGGQAWYRAADITLPPAAAGVVAWARNLAPNLDGLFHLAGSTGDDALRIKRSGLLNLSALEPDLTVLFSSVSAVLPGLDRGLEVYARANSWLDQHAIERHGAGRQVVSIAWPPWEGTGMAAPHAEAFRARGLEPIAPGLAMAAMEWAIGSGEPWVVVLNRGSQVVEAPEPLPADLEDRVRALVARAAGLDLDELSDDTPLMQLGIDSVEAMDLLRDLEQASGRALPTTLLFEHDTVGKILRALGTGVAREVEPTSPSASRDGPAPLPEEGWPLLPAQQTFAVQRSFFPDIPGNVLLACDLGRTDGAPVFDDQHLKEALALVVARHPALSTRIERVDGRWMQRPGGAPPELRWVERVDDRAVANEPFDLDSGPMLRLVTDGRRIVLNGHHGVVDAWSTRNLLQELLAAHEAIRGGVDPALPPLESGLVEAHRALRATPDQASMGWWKSRYALGVPPLQLAWRRPTHEPARGPCDWVRQELDVDLTERIEELARSASVGLPAMALATYAQVLFEASGQHDVVVRVAHGRREMRLPDAADLVGSFADSLPVRIQLRVREPLLALARRTQDALREVQTHTAASSLALADLAPRSGAGPVGLTPAGFSFPRLPAPERVGGLGISAVDGASASGFTRIGLIGWLFGGRLHASWNFTHSHLNPEQVQALADRFEAILCSAVEGVEQTLASTLHGRILARCRQHPERHAVEGVSYGQLERRSGSLAVRLLPALEAQSPEDLDPIARGTPLVAVLAHPSAAAVVALLGALRSGAAWVGLDPSWPAARTRQVLEIARPAALLCAPELEELAGDLAVDMPILVVDETERDDGPSRDAFLAHVMFTSGSTGRPKGVAVSHQAVLAFQDWVLRVFGVTDRDRFVQTSSLAFGGCIRQVFSPLLAGASIHPVDRATARDPERLLAFLEDQGITIFNAVPSLWVHLLGAVERSPTAEPLPAVRWVLLGGEAVPADPVRRWRARCGWRHRLANLYGSTETVVNATWFEAAGALEAGAIHTPIGQARSGIGVHLQNERDGVGDLVVSGAIAEGYLREPELTAQAFEGLEGLGRVYRTGDRVRRRPDGALVFLGRIDDQVQIHGNRVEPGEIEHALCTHPLVQAAVVVQAQGLLQAFLEAPTLDDPDTLRAWLAERLPAPLLPHRFHALERLPRTPAGKADRRALVGGTHTTPHEHEHDRVPPTALPLLARAWTDVLDLPAPPNEEDDFFALGGDSILALEVLEKLRAQLPWVPEPLALYQHPRLGQLAALLASGSRRAGSERPHPTPPLTGPRSLTTVQRGFWLAHRLQPEHPPCWTARVPLRGEVDPAAMSRALTWLVQRHPMLRATFPEPEGAPVQLIEERGDPLLQVDDLEPLSEPQRVRALEVRWAEEASARYELARWPLFRTRLCLLGPAESVLMVGGHHAVADAWSAWLLMGDLLAAHDAFHAGTPPDLGEPGTLPQDLHGAVPEADDGAWWRQCLVGLAQQPAPAREKDHQLRVSLASEDWEGLKLRAQALRVSPFLLTLAAMFETLTELEGPGDRVISTALAARDPSDPRAARVVGPMARALPLRVSGEPSLEIVATTLAHAAAHAYAAPADVVAAAGSQGLARLGRYFLSWMDPSAVPRPPTRVEPGWSEGRYRFATRSTDTELMVGAVVDKGLQLDLHGGAVAERAAPALLGRLQQRARPAAALVVYAPAGMALPVSQPLVVERIDAQAASSELVLAPITADALAPGPDLDALVARCLEATQARVVALAGMLPALTGLATRPLGGRPGQLLTSGHAATTVAMVLTLEAVLEATGRPWKQERVGVLGYGSIGRAVLALAHHRLGEPAVVLIQDPRHPDGVASLADATLILGATSGGRALNVAALAPGTLVVDDSFPRAFDDEAAWERMENAADVLLVGGGMLDAGPLLRNSPFPRAPALRARYGARWLPGCHAEAVLLAARPQLGPTCGPVSVERAMKIHRAVLDLGWRAAPLHLGARKIPDSLEIPARHSR